MTPLGSPLWAGSGPGLARAAGGRAASSRRALALTAGLFALAALSAGVTAWAALSGLHGAPGPARIRDFGFAAGLVALGAGLIGRFSPRRSPLAAPVFAVSGGVFAAGLTVAAELRFPGVAVTTLLIMAAAFITSLAVHVSGLIQVTARLRQAVFSAIAAVGVIYLGAFALRLLGVEVAWLSGVGLGPALWHGAVAVLACLNLQIDFDRVGRLDRSGLEPAADWHAALSVLTTLVWMYIALLRMVRSLRR